MTKLTTLKTVSPKRTDPKVPLIITKLGRASIGVDQDKANAVEDRAVNSLEKQAASLGSTTATPRPGSKLAEVIVLLTRKGGDAGAQGGKIHDDDVSIQ